MNFDSFITVFWMFGSGNNHFRISISNLKQRRVFSLKCYDGKAISELVKQEIAAEVAGIVAKGGKRPHLAAILVEIGRAHV